MSDQIARAVGVLAVPAVILLSIIVSGLSSLGIGKPELDVVAHLLDAPDETNAWLLRGRTLHNGEPVSNARVWAILRDARGNRDAPVAVRTDAEGGFTMVGISQTIGGEPVAEATVHARAELPSGDGDTTTLTGQEDLWISGKTSLRRVKLSVWALVFLPVIFLTSIVVAFVPLEPRWKHGFSICLAFLFTAAMIAAIAMGLSYVHANGRPGDIISLGFASFYHGTYVPEVDAEWLFTLTSPLDSTATIGDGQPEVSQGFGAPLWVLLVAVLGAALSTVSLIVKEIGDRPDFNDLDKVRKRIERITQHQIYILFAPMGAIFVYQTLVIAGAASQAVAVALAALGAGASLNVLLKRAIKASTDALHP